jgi:hypothetical protein
MSYLKSQRLQSVGFSDTGSYIRQQAVLWSWGKQFLDDILGYQNLASSSDLPFQMPGQHLELHLEGEVPSMISY